MKKFLILMLASCFLGVAAQAEVGKDKDKPDCSKVIAAIQKSLKDSQPQGSAETPSSSEDKPNSDSAQ